MASNTPQVSGKVKAGSIAATVASFVVGAVVTFADTKVPALKETLGNPLVTGTAIGFVTGVLTFASGYIARHLPANLVEDVREAVSTEVSQANIDEAEEQASK